jgi:hypothetical protein
MQTLTSRQEVPFDEMGMNCQCLCGLTILLSVAKERQCSERVSRANLSRRIPKIAIHEIPRVPTVAAIGNGYLFQKSDVYPGLLALFLRKGTKGLSVDEKKPVGGSSVRSDRLTEGIWEELGETVVTPQRN